MGRQLDNIEMQDIRDTADDLSGMLVREGVVPSYQSEDAFDLIYNYLHHKKENE